jgi:hypothetical protein
MMEYCTLYVFLAFITSPPRYIKVKNVPTTLTAMTPTVRKFCRKLDAYHFAWQKSKIKATNEGSFDL